MNEWLLVATYLVPVIALIGLNWSLTCELNEYTTQLSRILDTMDKMALKILDQESEGET